MEYQKIINLLDNTPNQLSKLRTNNLVEINDESRETCNTNSQTKFKTSMINQVFVITVIHIYLQRES